MRRIPESELIVNPDGTIFHLHLLPEQLADKIVMMGDPKRVDMAASLFDERICSVQNREFKSVTGRYKGKQVTAMSHGIGGDNIDIVLNELDALANIDLETRTVKSEKRSLMVSNNTLICPIIIISTTINPASVVIIACSPSLGRITVNSLAAADSIIIPVQPEFFALEGLGKLLQTIKLVQKGINPALTIEGFLVTMFDGRTKVHSQVVSQLKEHFGDMVFKSIIQRNIRLSEAPSHGKPIILYDVVSNGTTNYLNFAKEVLENNR